MSYTKTNWHDGDVITAAKMNKIEDGIENSLSEKLQALYKTMVGNDWPYENNPTDAEVIDKIAKDASSGGDSLFYEFHPWAYENIIPETSVQVQARTATEFAHLDALPEDGSTVVIHVNNGKKSFEVTNDGTNAISLYDSLHGYTITIAQDGTCSFIATSGGIYRVALDRQVTGDIDDIIANADKYFIYTDEDIHKTEIAKLIQNGPWYHVVFAPFTDVMVMGNDVSVAVNSRAFDIDSIDRTITLTKEGPFFIDTDY